MAYDRPILRGLLGLVVQDQKLAARERKLRIGAPLVIGELNFKDAGRKGFDDRADLAAEQAPLGQV